MSAVGERRPVKARASAREAILAVFARHVAERGYSDTSIGDVAGELGLSKGTIVFHFRSKQALLDIVVHDYMQRRMDEAHHLLGTLGTPGAQLAGMIYALLAAHRDDRDATRASMRELVRFAGDDSDKGVRNLRRNYTNILVGILQRGMDDGTFSVRDSSVTALQVFGMCNYAWTWYHPDGPLTLEQIAESFIETLLTGLMQPTSGERQDLQRLVADARHALSRIPVSR